MAVCVPLLKVVKLVYHESMLMTWRWNHAPDRRRRAEHWDDQDLLHLLYGGMPNSSWWTRRTWRQRATEGCRTIIRDFIETVAGHEMVKHCFLTEDRLAQETRFANGRSVIVNFSAERAFDSPHGTVKPKSFLTCGP